MVTTIAPPGNVNALGMSERCTSRFVAAVCPAACTPARTISATDAGAGDAPDPGTGVAAAVGPTAKPPNDPAGRLKVTRSMPISSQYFSRSSSAGARNTVIGRLAGSRPA